MGCVQVVQCSDSIWDGFGVDELGPGVKVFSWEDGETPEPSHYKRSLVFFSLGPWSRPLSQSVSECVTLANVCVPAVSFAVDVYGKKSPQGGPSMSHNPQHWLCPLVQNCSETVHLQTWGSQLREPMGGRRGSQEGGTVCHFHQSSFFPRVGRKGSKKSANEQYFHAKSRNSFLCFPVNAQILFTPRGKQGGRRMRL